MSFDYKCVKMKYPGGSIRELIKGCNGNMLPDGVIDKVEEAFKLHNPNKLISGNEIWIPILPPFFKKYNELYDKDNLDTAPLKQREVRQTKPKGLPQAAAQKVAEPTPRSEHVPPPVTEEPAIQPRDRSVEERLAKRPIHSSGKMQYRLYPYQFSRPNETIEAVIRLYNDMNVARSVLNKLMYEFTQANEEALPPKLGQKVKIPVLLPFCYRHENNHKIFTDE